MDGKVSIRYNVLERMLLNENEKPTRLPLSLLEAITNNFSSEQEIGRGGFAVVYKGMLGVGKVVAVKKLSKTLGILDDQRYSREVQCLMKARHKNIVRFLGYCSDTQGEMVDYEGKLVMADLRNRLLCFEFVPGGSLCDHINDASSGLDWRLRYQIIKGICEGLHYLHETRIVHLDLKPANILLDDKMVPKIADFGISRCFDEKQSKDITSKLIGSIGYLAPEYYSGHITMKLDIYSLGVVIIEVLTGAKGYVAIEKVLDNWRNRLELQEGDTPLQQIRACTEIGIRCIDSNPDDRPTMQCIMRKFEELESVYGFIEAGAITSVAQVSFLSDSGKNDGGFVNRASWPPAPPLKRMKTSTKILTQNQMQQQQPSMTQNQQPAASQLLLLPHQQQHQHQLQKLVHQDGRGKKFVPLSELQQQLLLQQQQLQQQLNKMAAQVPNLSPHQGLIRSGRIFIPADGILYKYKLSIWPELFLEDKPWEPNEAQLQLSDQQLQLQLLQKLQQQPLSLLSQPASTLAQLSLIQEQQKLVIDMQQQLSNSQSLQQQIMSVQSTKVPSQATPQPPPGPASQNLASNAPPMDYLETASSATSVWLSQAYGLPQHCFPMYNFNQHQMFKDMAPETDMAFNSTDSGMNDGGFVNRTSWPPAAPLKRMRIFTKVYKRGAVGRSMDISRFNGYDELKHALACMFGMEGQLEDRQRLGWKLVYKDNEDDILLLGTDPWEEFVNWVKCIRILSPHEVQQMSLDGDLGNSIFDENQGNYILPNEACSSTDGLILL